ncbi:MAG: ParA family protein, partial [Chloroflexota bacterium]|nr:ParA family protein [Chloroflexota bacterium]
LDKNSLSISTYDALINKVLCSQIIVPTQWQNLELLPSAPALAGAGVEMVHLLAREHLLRKALAPVADLYHYILIDPPPSLGLLTINALTAAAGGVIIPVQCEYLALEGLSELLRTIMLVRDSLNPRLYVRGLLMTMYDGRTNLSAQVAAEVQRHFKDRVFRTIIPRSVRLSEAPSYGEPILAYAPHSSGALAYQTFAQELLNGDERQDTAGIRGK